MIDADYGPDPEWMATDCPGGLSWDCCHADDCGVQEDGTCCQLSLIPGEIDGARFTG